MNKDHYIRPAFTDSAGRFHRARVVWVSRSKYTPHQGKGECERRREQMSAMTHGYGWQHYAAMGFPRNALVAEHS